MVLPGLDPRLVGAVARGVVLSCVTAAERAGLWVPEKRLLHVAARPNAARLEVPPGVVVHWARPLVPRDPELLEDGIVNSLVLIAGCLPLEHAVVVWESALNAGVVDRAFLSAFELPSAARAVLDRARPFADSGLESILVFRLRWLGVRMLPQAWILGRRVDLLMGERLVIQADGATHTGLQRSNDIAHDRQLTLRGYHVLRFSYEQIMDRWPDVQAAVMEAIAQGRHLA
ncbi:endonuclease domain-containing protein [Microbacterium sp. NPDC089695]|uniref:endonuclease domain-containing protein n=1 Tax=Microbacterium sp. NPDC089695 TaxID=3364198 RepID=UPI0038233D81